MKCSLWTRLELQKQKHGQSLFPPRVSLGTSLLVQKCLMTKMTGVGSVSNGGSQGAGLLLNVPACVTVALEINVHVAGLQRPDALRSPGTGVASLFSVLTRRVVCPCIS